MCCIYATDWVFSRDGVALPWILPGVYAVIGLVAIIATIPTIFLFCYEADENFREKMRDAAEPTLRDLMKAEMERPDK